MFLDRILAEKRKEIAALRKSEKGQGVLAFASAKGLGRGDRVSKPSRGLGRAAQVSMPREGRDEKDRRLPSYQPPKAGSGRKGGGNPFLRAIGSGKGIAVIAEIKKGSPSRGLLRPDLEPGGLARIYQENGARALSVLTDRTFFYGEKAFIPGVRRVTNLPILRKDFILDPIQVEETYCLGADALLLIARLLPRESLESLLRYAESLGMEALVEVHSEEDLDKAVWSGARCVGINNRDLETFQVDLGVTRRLAPLVPADCLLVSESGIQGPEDLPGLLEVGVKAVLVGEYLVTGDPGQRLAALVQGGSRSNR
ncbi:MAG: indole-3-glycerol phosphate synthase TrpC [Firmicutes bacterium]|nr:indole-3-glycerol phosphate synthase TrpC [Bacillota bacterium]